MASLPFRTGRPHLWVTGLVLLVLIVGGIIWTRGGDNRIVPGPVAPPGSAATQTRGDDAARLLDRLEAGLTQGERADVLALAVPRDARARAELGSIFDNVRKLRLTDLTLRYVDENTGMGRGNTFGADVQLSWRISGFDAEPSRMEVRILLAEHPRGAFFVSARGVADAAGDPVGGPPVVDDTATGTPLWLLSDLAVERSRRALVMVADRQQVAQFSRLAGRAVADVRRVLVRWQGKLVVEVPPTEEDLEQIVGAEDDAYQSIAAVTSTVDGSVNPASPGHILVNPPVFGRLSDDGAQIVMSHEATHVATQAATSSVPMWLLEGFADYVALDGVELPVSVTASQILAEVRRDGAPHRLPAANAFDPANKALGTSYEAAWLACRLIGDRYGQRRLVGLYHAVDRGLPLREGFRRFLEVDQEEFTDSWRDYLKRLAG